MHACLCFVAHSVVFGSNAVFSLPAAAGVDLSRSSCSKVFLSNTSRDRRPMAGRAAGTALTFGSRAPAASAGRRAGPSDAGLDGGRGLRTYLLSQFQKGQLTAKDVCSISWHSMRAGAAGVGDLALDPSDTHHARHLRHALGMKARELSYVISVPMWCAHTDARVYKDFPLMLPHESFAQNYERQPDEFDVTTVPSDDLPPHYAGHPVTIARGTRSVPIGFYSDGVPHTKKDSMLCFYWNNVLSETRYLIATVRKSDLCQCGCRGGCTLGPIMRTIVWSFNVLAAGLFPGMDQDDQPFQSDLRAARRGFELADGLCGALCEMRADLLEFVTSLGFRRWDNVAAPCFGCNCTRAQLFAFPLSLSACPWQPKTSAMYEDIARNSIKKVTVTSRDQLLRLLACMRHDFDIGGFGLWKAFPELGLRRGFRLCVDKVVKDTHRVSTLVIPPGGALLTFFDSTNELGLTFVSPLFEVVGFTIEMLCYDLMHVLDLGTSQYIVAAVFAALITSNFCGSRQATVDLRNKANLFALRRRMKAFYIAEHELHERTPTKIFRVTLKQLGFFAEHYRLRAKAAETRHLIRLLPDLCREFPACFADGTGPLLPLACQQLLAFHEVVDSNPRRTPPAAQAAMETHMLRFLQYWKAFGGHLVYKHHACLHVVLRARFLGNPRTYWTYLGEGENRAMGQVAKRLHHGSTFYAAFLERVLTVMC